MTLPQAEAQLQAVGFTLHDDWRQRLFERWAPRLGGAFAFEEYAEFFEADRGTKCDRAYHPCTGVSVGFVRYPSGRLRVYTIYVTELTTGEAFVSAAINQFEEKLGSPDSAQWGVESKPGTTSAAAWEANWRPRDPQDAADYLNIRVYTVEAVQLEGTRLAVPDSIRTLHVDEVDFAVFSFRVAYGVMTAWAHERAGWIADPRTGCRVWNETGRDTDSIHWEGPCLATDALRRGRNEIHRHGSGTLYSNHQGGSEHRAEAKAGLAASGVAGSRAAAKEECA